MADLDRIHLRYSYKHVCMVTLIVGDVAGHEEWHLPTYDPHNQNKYHYKLHSIDVYFWTPQDAAEFVNGIRRVLPAEQCEILDEPGPPPRQHAEVSAVVQQLERAAIDDHYVPTPPSTVDPHGLPTFPGPPTAVSSTSDSPAPPPPPAQFIPMAYNPAAPPAPEQVRHREKTPPPDDGIANPLHQTLAYDASTPFSPGLVPSGLGPLSPGFAPPPMQHPTGAPSFAPPPQQIASPGFAPQGFGSLGGHPTGLSQHPAQHPGLSRAATMPVGLGSPGLVSPFPSSGGYTQGSHTPTPPGLSASVPPPPVPHSAQTGAGYTYNPAAAALPQPGEYAVHQQFYVPEGGGQHKAQAPMKEPRGKMEERAGKLEKGVTGMLKRMEKKFG